MERLTTNQSLLLTTYKYKAYIRPHFEYACPVWNTLHDYLTENVQKLQRRTMRIILEYQYRHPIEDSQPTQNFWQFCIKWLRNRGTVMGLSQ